MAAWWELWAHPKDLMQTLEINAIRNRKDIKRGIEDEESDLASHQYFEAGKDLADILVAFMGPAPHVHPESIIIDGNKLTNVVVAKMISGFVFGMVGQNDMDIIVDCY